MRGKFEGKGWVTRVKGKVKGQMEVNKDRGEEEKAEGK